jgi:hypothetical protein
MMQVFVLPVVVIIVQKNTAEEHHMSYTSTTDAYDAA